MHRRIRAIVQAGNLDTAVENAVTGLENAMDDDILPTGTVSTLVGDHTMFTSTYFQTDADQAGHRFNTSESKDALNEAREDMEEHGSTFIYAITDGDSLNATPIPTDQAFENLMETLESKDEPHWVVTFDLRYDFDATPHKPYETLARHEP